MAFNNANSMQLLKTLFEQCQLDEDVHSDSENELESGILSGCKINPADLKPATKSCHGKREENPLHQTVVQEDPQSLSEWQILQDDINAAALDARKQPDYSISYKQAVTTQDLYLQLNCKTAATSSCEHMIVKIQLPGETVGIDKMELKVEQHQVTLSTPLYQLKLQLPQPINPNKSKAEFDSDTQNLKLTLLMTREFDFVNF